MTFLLTERKTLKERIDEESDVQMGGMEKCKLGAPYKREKEGGKLGNRRELAGQSTFYGY